MSPAPDSRVAIVTGGGRGVGRAISLALARDGADIAVNFAKDRQSAEQTAKEVEALGRRAAVYQAGVEDEAADIAMVEQVVADFGRIDILVSNGGIASRGTPVVKTTAEELLRVVSIHALGPHYLCRAVIPHMKEQGRGDIVMISSAATLGMAANGAPYNMGKAALEALAFTLAKEVRRYGIHVNVVAPGLVETEMGRRLMKAAAGVEDLRTLDQHMPFGHVCQPEDVADVVAFFCSDAARYVTGEKLTVHGGGQGPGG